MIINKIWFLTNLNNLWITGGDEWILVSWRWSQCRRALWFPVIVYKWIAGSYILIWPTLHCPEEQKCQVMEVWHRFVKWLRSFLVAKSSLSTGIWNLFFLVLLILNLGWLRSFIADYGVPLMVLMWSALSLHVPKEVPRGVPRRLFCPLPWEPKSLKHWTVMKVILCSSFPISFSDLSV